jgi:dihydrofolate reductase
MGRVTYLDMAAYWPVSDDPMAEPLNEIPKAVFSKTLVEATWGPAEIASGELAAEIARLKQEPGKDIVAHGGAGFAQAVTSSGLVDEYWLLVHPVVLGDGLPLFVAPAELDLISTRTFSSGAIGHVYRPAPNGRP